MRNAKFRAYDTKLKKWVCEGFHVVGEVTMFSMIQSYIYENMADAECSLLRMKDIDITQWVGIQDRNGKDIYDGDLVNKTVGGKNYNAEVIFGKKTLGFGVHVKYIHHSYFIGDEKFNSYRDKFYRLSTKDEIVGNIYEMPVLPF